MGTSYLSEAALQGFPLATAERLVSLKELGRQAPGVDASWTGLAPDDSPLALRDIGTQEIYALDWEAP